MLSQIELRVLPTVLIFELLRSNDGTRVALTFSSDINLVASTASTSDLTISQLFGPFTR